MYTPKSIAAIIGMDKNSIINRAINLNFRKTKNLWLFDEKQFKSIVAYGGVIHRSKKFDFTDDGYFLVIQSKINYRE